jgi:dolichol-phosphate mannosyltransferase
MSSALVCIPTYNERDNLEGIVQAVLAADSRTDVLVVDDNSPDRTGDLADALVAREPRVHVLHRERKEGLGRAYLAAFGWALQRPYAYVLEMDADFSHPPRYLPELLDRAEAGVDLVLGSRYVPGGGTVNWGWARRAISRGGSLYARAVLGLPVRDLTGGFKCFRRQVLESIDLAAVKSTGYAFQIELTYRTYRKGFRVEEVPIVFEDRRVGQSKMSRRIVVEALTMVWKLRFTV